MNKTAIKNFAIWARNKLIADIQYRAGLMGITAEGIKNALPQSTPNMEFYDIGTAEPYSITGEAIQQRKKLVEILRQKEKDSDYATAYKYILEEVAYTWFNRLIAIRFMEVNDYLPSHIRVLSSETGKVEPDLVTTPFDTELDFTPAEEENILRLKTDNALDELFRLLFIKQCNALNEILPALFEKTNDYTELLLNLSVVDQDGVVYSEGAVLRVPYVELRNDQINQQIMGNVGECVNLSRYDWDSFETSWDFQKHPLVPLAHERQEQESSQFRSSRIEKFGSIAWHYDKWAQECEGRFNQLKANEEELNRIFIDIYGLQDELTPEVEDKDVTVRKADLQRDIKSLLSYAVGCMFGRYSLDSEGLAYAGGDWDESKYKTFLPDVDGIIPITDEEYLGDDIVTRLCSWLKIVYGEDTLEENVDFIAKALGGRGSSSREIIRNYFLKDFFKDHCKIYQKRPIYWLFDSGKQNGFKALIYLHRYTPDTIGNLRVDYLHKMQRVYESEIGRMQDMIDHSTNAREVAAATKRKEKLQKQLKECREYDEMIGHLALSRIELDLDDGVKVNYEKIQTASDGKKYSVLAKI